MKKLIFAGAILLAGASFTSCKKCSSCSIGDPSEYCRGGALQNTIYDSAKASCNASGGSWD